MKKLKKRYLLIIALILLILIIYPPLTYEKLSNDNPLPENIVKGVFHIHSDFSDGKGGIDEITRAAENHDLDFVILTDHGEPNIKCAESTSYMNNVLLIGASEFSLDCGHLAAAGFKVEKYQFPREPQEAINDVNGYKGFSFISHPFDKKIPWTDWDVKDFTGIEVLSSYSSARRIGFMKMIAFPARYILNREYALLSSLEYPEHNFKVLDQLNNNGRYLGIYALDAHARIPLTRKISLNFPSYESIFGTLNVYIKTGSPLPADPTLASKQIIECIKKGRFFNVIEGISPANGFEIVYRSSMRNIHETGESISDSTGTILLTLPFDFPVRIKIIKDGEQYFVNRIEPSTNAQVRINEHGVYRCEIYADTGKFKKLPWIATNPFFLNIKEKEKDKQDQIRFTKTVFDQIESFKVEKNRSSSGTIEYKNPESGEQSVTLDYVLKGESGEKDYWVSLAARESIDLSDFTGISFETRSSEPMRYWLEVRTKSDEEEFWYRHSFLSTPEWSRILIPFGKMVLIYGEMENRSIDQSKIGSMFISINNSIVNFPETKGRIDLKNIFSYK